MPPRHVLHWSEDCGVTVLGTDVKDCLEKKDIAFRGDYPLVDKGSSYLLGRSANGDKPVPASPTQVIIYLGGWPHEAPGSAFWVVSNVR